ncbi:MAG: hypothetical protein D3904_12340 [Candidatus Electrothrix sp. EH2]|nr:hypothetical protein [Candidatus Electrothrix sp. EH2]
MPDSSLNRAAIAKSLGEQLPDQILTTLFPDYPLADGAGLCGKQKTTRPLLRQTGVRRMRSRILSNYLLTNRPLNFRYEERNMNNNEIRKHE